MNSEPKAETMISRLRDRIAEALNRPVAITLDEEPEEEIPEEWIDEGDTPTNPPPINGLTDLELGQLLPPIPDSGRPGDWRRTCEQLLAAGVDSFGSPRAYYNFVVNYLGEIGCASMEEVEPINREDVQSEIEEAIEDLIVIANSEKT